MQSQDFRDSTKRQLKQINEDEKFQKNAILSKIEQKANELNLNTEDQVVQHEQQTLLEHLNPKEIKEKAKLLEQERNVSFYQELKHKRVKKIKSKLYHKIKNKVHLIN